MKIHMVGVAILLGLIGAGFAFLIFVLYVEAVLRQLGQL